jgi:hypothetical protein
MKQLFNLILICQSLGEFANCVCDCAQYCCYHMWQSFFSAPWGMFCCSTAKWATATSSHSFPRFLDLSATWRWVVSFTPLQLYPWGRSLITHWTGGWVNPRAGLNNMEKWKFLTLLGLELRPLCRQACSQLLYQLCYRGSYSVRVVSYVSMGDP